MELEEGAGDNNNLTLVEELGIDPIVGAPANQLEMVPEMTQEEIEANPRLRGDIYARFRAIDAETARSSPFPLYRVSPGGNILTLKQLLERFEFGLGRLLREYSYLYRQSPKPIDELSRLRDNIVSHPYLKSYKEANPYHLIHVAEEREGGIGFPVSNGMFIETMDSMRTQTSSGVFSTTPPLVYPIGRTTVKY